MTNQAQNRKIRNGNGDKPDNEQPHQSAEQEYPRVFPCPHLPTGSQAPQQPGSTLPHDQRSHQPPTPPQRPPPTPTATKKTDSPGPGKRRPKPKSCLRRSMKWRSLCPAGPKAPWIHDGGRTRGPNRDEGRRWPWLCEDLGKKSRKGKSFISRKEKTSFSEGKRAELERAKASLELGSRIAELDLGSFIFAGERCRRLPSK